MKFFISEGKVFAYESDGSQDHLIPDGAEPITEDQAVHLANPQPTYTRRELDQQRYKRRADVQADLLAYMAADNMSRVRSGIWSVADLTALMADPAITGVLAWMQTLSYEKAAELIAQATHPLLTPAIKADWIGKLQAHFYLEP